MVAGLSKRLLVAGAVALGAWTAPTSVQAAVIYFDDFDGSAATNLVGTAPDTRSGLAGGSSTATWQGTAGTFKADGSIGATSFNGAYLAFTPQAGNVYRLEADVNATGSGGWLGFGFSLNQGNDTHASSGVQGRSWMLLEPTRGAGKIQTFRAQGDRLEGGTSHAAPTGVVDLRIELDTTGSQWVTTWFVNDAQIRQATYTANPTTIGYIGISGLGGAGGTVDNFSLETVDAVPEPASLGLLGLGAVGLLARRRRA